MSKLLRVLMLTKYGRLGASSRMRSLQYLPWFEQSGLQVTVQSLLSDDQLLSRYHRGGYALNELLRSYSNRLGVLLQRRQFDVLWIEAEALPWWPLWVEQGLLRGVPYILDFDDAIFHNYDQHCQPWVRWVYGRRLDGLMAQAVLVVGGNDYLAQRARDAGTRWVEVLSTVIDLARYPVQSKEHGAMQAPDTPFKIVWIGTPGNVHYLDLLREPLQALAAQHSFVLRVIGAAAFSVPGVRVEVLPWSEATEVEVISACDIGVMPLQDSPWERGKCGYKLIQYMACGLPVVASGVGVNSKIVCVGENGFLANTADEWLAALGQLLGNATLRRQMGVAGRQRVEDEFCIQKTGPRLAQLLRAVGQGSN